MISKNGRNLSVKDATPENYACPAGEEHLFHVKIENPHFDQRTGERRSHPRIQKFGRKAYHSLLRSALAKSGYELVILHDPDEWAKSHPSGNSETRVSKSGLDIEKIKAELREELKEELKAELAEETKKPSSKGNKKKASPDPVPEGPTDSTDPEGPTDPDLDL